MQIPHSKELAQLALQARISHRLTTLGFNLRKGDHLRVAKAILMAADQDSGSPGTYLRDVSEERLRDTAYRLEITNRSKSAKDLSAYLAKQEKKAALRAKRAAEKQAHEKKMQNDFERLVDMTPAKRWKELDANPAMEIWIQQKALWPAGWMEALAEWRTLQAEKKRLAAQQRKQRAEARERAILVPATPHFEVEMREDLLHLYCDMETWNLRSARMDEDLSREVTRCFSRIQDAFFETKNRVLHLQIPRTKASACLRAMERAETTIHEFVHARLPPYYVEEILCILPRERRRWTQDGRLPVAEYITIHKARVGDLRVPMYDPLIIRNITRDKLASWRVQDRETTAKKRAKGVLKAQETRKRQDALREQARALLDERARKAAVELGSPAAYPVHYLAMLAAIASRHAKEAQERGNGTQKDQYYAIKEQAIRAILQTPFAHQSFVPAHQPRYQIRCCDSHFETYREERHWAGGEYPFLEWALDNLRMLQQCRDCQVRADPLYYAFFSVAVGPDSDRIVLHTPYYLGCDLGFANRSDLPLADHESEGWDESGFLFGRPSDAEEKMLYTDTWLEAQVQDMLHRLERLTVSDAHPDGGTSHVAC